MVTGIVCPISVEPGDFDRIQPRFCEKSTAIRVWAGSSMTTIIINHNLIAYPYHRSIIGRTSEIVCPCIVDLNHPSQLNHPIIEIALSAFKRIAIFAKPL